MSCASPITLKICYTYLLSSLLPLPFLRLFFAPRPRALPGLDRSVAEELTRPAWSCQPFQLYTATSVTPHKIVKNNAEDSDRVASLTQPLFETSRTKGEEDCMTIQLKGLWNRSVDGLQLTSPTPSWIHLNPSGMAANHL